MMFDADRLISEAVRAAAYSDFNGEGWRPSFYRMVASLNERPYDQDAQSRIKATLIGTLKSRLMIERWIAQHPDIERQKILGPVIIFGLPRTASTALQNVLSVDGRWRFLRGWEANEPVPPPQFGKEEQDERYLRERAFIDQDKTYLGKHIQIAGGPVEDTALVRLNFGGQEQGWPIFSYTRWWRDQSQLATFEYVKRAFKLLQSDRPPNRWMIKSPWYAFHLDDLRKAFPNAKFVMTHRNPREIIPSTCSLHYTRYATFLADEHIDKHEIGAQAIEHWSIGMRRALDYRRRNYSDDIFDIYHGPFNEDPMGNLRKLYEWLDVELTQEAEDAMSAWTVENRRGVHGEHRYSAADYGITDEAIDHAFAEYKETFGL
jgi:hypothetical protein